MPPKKPPAKAAAAKAPAKGKKEKEVPLTPAEILRIEAVEVVTDLVREAFDGAIAVLEEKRLARAVTSHTTVKLREAIVQALELFHIGADPGEADLLDATWTADEEPLPVSNDTWSREVLSLLGPEVKLSATGAQQAAPAKPEAISRESSRVSTPAHWAAHAKLFDAPAPPRAKEDSRPKPNVSKVNADAQRVPPRSEADAELNMLAKTRLARQLGRESHEDLRRVAALQEELGGRDYVYDSNERVLVRTPVVNDRLPRMIACTGAQVSETTYVRDTLGQGNLAGAAAAGRRMSAAVRPSTVGALRARSRSRTAPSGLVGPLFGADENKIVPAQPPLLDLISAPNAGVRVLENGNEAFGGMLPIEKDGAIPLRVFQKLVGGRNVAAVISQEEAQRERAHAAREAVRASPLLHGGSSARAGAAPASTLHAFGGGGGASSLGEPSQAPSATSGGFARSPSPTREDFPDTAEFRGLKVRERVPVARHNLGSHGNGSLPAHKLAQARQAAPTSSSWLENKSSQSAFPRSRSAMSEGTLTIHSPERHIDIMQLAGK